MEKCAYLFASSARKGLGIPFSPLGKPSGKKADALFREKWEKFNKNGGKHVYERSTR